MNSNNSNYKSLNWYPGHIKVALRELQGKWLPVLDILIQVIDSRIPKSTVYPEPAIFKNKKLVYFFSKTDLTDQKALDLIIRENQETYREFFIANLLENSWRKKFVSFLSKISQKEKEALEKKGRYRKIRFGICGLPNVGKSSLLNKIANKKLKTENRPGVTKKSTLISFKDFDLLDTPGLLPLKTSAEKIKKFQICGLLPLDKSNIQVKIELIKFLFILIEEKYSRRKLQELEEFYKKVKEVHLDLPENIFLSRYQKGKYGNFCLD